MRDFFKARRGIVETIIITMGIAFQVGSIFVLTKYGQCDVCGQGAFNLFGWHQLCDVHADEFLRMHPEFRQLNTANSNGPQITTDFLGTTRGK